VNEIELLRAQLATEHRHVSAAANAGAAATADAPAVRAAATDYLRCVLVWFEARDLRLAELLRARTDMDERTRRGLQAALAQPGASDVALGKLTAAAGAAGAAGAWQDLAHFVGTAWGPRRDTLDALLGSLARPADWRAIAGIDADSILEERRRFQRLLEGAPC
jgi:hypothetical protein